MANCSECSVNFADLQCSTCGGDYFCKDCFDQVHHTEVKASKFKSHKIVNVNLFDKISQKSNNFLKNDGGDTSWHKFEPFNFPLGEENDLFT